MATASVIAAIGFGGTVFMLWVLIALLREGVPWSRYEDALVEPRRKEALQVSVVSDRMHLPDLRSSRSDDRVELSENQNHEKGEHGSGLTAVDVGIISGKFGGRPVRAKYSGIRWEPGL
ncbi:MAG: hypothetical protein WCD47_10840 [Candidatus Sulfotelmatobacter sp.]